MRCKIIILALTALALYSQVGAAGAQDCFDDQPVGSVVITVGADAQGSRTSGFFPVAVGSTTLTMAAVTVHWLKQNGVVRLTARFHYEMPGSVGLAYNFYQLLWAGSSSEMVRHDLTRGCTAPGVSLFPNQAWNAGEYSYTVRDEPGATVVFVVWGGLG